MTDGKVSRRTKKGQICRNDPGGDLLFLFHSDWKRGEMHDGNPVFSESSSSVETIFGAELVQGSDERKNIYLQSGLPNEEQRCGLPETESMDILDQECVKVKRFW